MDREEIEQTAGAAGYGRSNNIKHGEMEDAFMNFASATAAQDTYFTDMTTTNDNLSTQLRQREDHIWALQEKLWNLKVVVATQTTDVKIYSKLVQPYSYNKK